MRTIFGTLILVALFITSYAQDDYGTLTLDGLSEGKNPVLDINYLFRNHLGNIIDVRTGKTVSNEPCVGNLKQLSDGSIVYKGKSNTREYLQFYTEDLQKGKLVDIKRKGQLSPNWEYLISVKDGDLYRSDLNLDSKSFTPSKQVTQLGVFKGAWLEYLYWYKDIIIIKGLNGPNDRGYRIDTKTLGIDYLPETILYVTLRSKEISPTGRFVTMPMKNYNRAIYDIETNTICLKIKDWKSKNPLIYWNDYNTFSFFTIPNNEKRIVLRTQSIGSNNHADLLVYSWEDPKESTPFIIETLDMWDSEKTTVGRTYYPKGKMFTNQGVIYTAHKPAKLVYKSVITGEWLTIAEPDDMWDWGYNAGLVDEYGKMSWTNNDKILYTYSKDLLKQGTFVFNISTKKSEKLTNYVTNDFFKLHLTEYTLFIANKILYSYNSNTGELKEMGESIDSRYQRGVNQINILNEEYSIK